MKDKGKSSTGTYSRIGLVLAIAAVILIGMAGKAGAISGGGVPGTCTTVSEATPVDYGEVPVTTAAVVATTGEHITGTIDATGCQVGVYVGPGVTGVTITATISNAQVAGVYVDGGNADVIGSTISNIGDTPHDGIQYGWGILYATSTGGSAATGKVVNTQVSNYQKAGIVSLGAGTYVILSGDTIIGLGPIAFTAQNGVEFVSGATGSVTNSKISGDSYQGGPTSCPAENYFGEATGYIYCYQSGGILLYDALPNVVVSNNKVSTSDVGIWVYDDPSYTNTAATPYVVNNNNLQNNYGYGLVFDSVYGTSKNNNLQGNPVGLLVTDSSADSYVTSINDQFMNNVVNNEALDAGSGNHENLIVETTSLPFRFPIPGFPHHPHFGV